jgi:hypothetical protein
MAFHPGMPKKGGRQKGTTNKINRDLKEMILTALNGVGGVKYLQEQAAENPTAFISLIGKVLPHTIQGDANHPLSIVIATGVPRDDAD